MVDRTERAGRGAAPQRGEERRDSHRVPVRLMVRDLALGGSFEERPGKLSLGGVFYLDGHPPQGNRVEMRFVLPGTRHEVEGLGGVFSWDSHWLIPLHASESMEMIGLLGILAEAELFTHHPEFKGIIQDLGGPTANMYGFDCAKKLASGACPDKRCLFPAPCPALKVDHRPQLDLLRKVRRLKGVKKVFIASGLRYDLLEADHAYGDKYP